MGDEADSGRLKRTRHVSSKMAQFLQETVKRKSGVSRYMGDSGDGDEQVDNTVIVVNQFPENNSGEKRGRRKSKNGKRGRSKEDSVDPIVVDTKKRSSQEITDQLIEAINGEFQKGRLKKTKGIEDDGESRRSKNKSPSVGKRAQVLDVPMEEDNDVSISHSRPGSSTDEDTLIQLSKDPIVNGVKFPKTSAIEDQSEISKISETQALPRYYNDAHNVSRSMESQKMKVFKSVVRHPFIPSKFKPARKSDHVSQVPFQKIPKVVVPVQPRPDSVSDQENRIQNSTVSEAQPTPRYYNDVHNVFPPREPQKLSIVKPIIRNVLGPYKLPTKKKTQIQPIQIQKIQKIVPAQPRPESTSDQENWVKPHPPEIQPILMYYNDVHNVFPPAEQNYRYFYVSKDGSEFIYQPLQVHRTQINASEMICPPEELYPQTPDTPGSNDEVVEVNPGIFLTVL